MWVYTYKFNKKGLLTTTKARLVVRRDQQVKVHGEDTYASTLAVRTFRTLIAIAARFDLELIQFDAMNAFVNVPLDEEVYMRLPPGYRTPGKIARLKKALYGLRRSPLLWQREFSATLYTLGFTPVPSEPCIMTLGGIIVFFYVDDIVFAYRKDQRDLLNKKIAGLKEKYTLTGGGELSWFLGIEVVRDRIKRLIWLSQASYIDKIRNLAATGPTNKIPMSGVELLPYDGIATSSQTTHYMRKIGSLLYAAVVTRPDIASATSRLARLNRNPGPQHHAAADQVLRYLHGTRGLALQFGGGDDFITASDASFADNTLDRKSTHAYAMKLFNGLIGWRSSKQDTVTTSTTEAELLALSQAAKESMFIYRLIKEVGVRLDHSKILLQCDNTQTINCVTADVHILKTRLRHVDIHNHWLRQEQQRRALEVVHTPTDSMIADGLTKALPHHKHARLCMQLGLVDITGLLHRRRLQELEEEDLLP